MTDLTYREAVEQVNAIYLLWESKYIFPYELAEKWQHQLRMFQEEDTRKFQEFIYQLRQKQEGEE